MQLTTETYTPNNSTLIIATIFSTPGGRPIEGDWDDEDDEDFDDLIEPEHDLHELKEEGFLGGPDDDDDDHLPDDDLQ